MGVSTAQFGSFDRQFRIASTKHEANAAVRPGASVARTEPHRVTSLWRALRVWWLARQNARALSKLSQRTLRDIGVNRAEIPGLAKRAAERAVARRNP